MQSVCLSHISLTEAVQHRDIFILLFVSGILRPFIHDMVNEQCVKTTTRLMLSSLNETPSSIMLKLAFVWFFFFNNYCEITEALYPKCLFLLSDNSNDIIVMDLNFSTENLDSVSRGETFGHNRSDLHHNEAVTQLKPTRVEYQTLNRSFGAKAASWGKCNDLFSFISATQSTNSHLNGFERSVRVWMSVM